MIVRQEELMEQVVNLYDNDLLRFTEGPAYINKKAIEIIQQNRPNWNKDDVEKFDIDCLIRWATKD